jgi:hypothetical protein
LSKKKKKKKKKKKEEEEEAETTTTTIRRLVNGSYRLSSSNQGRNVISKFMLTFFFRMTFILKIIAFSESTFSRTLNFRVRVGIHNVPAGMRLVNCDFCRFLAAGIRTG